MQRSKLVPNRVEMIIHSGHPLEGRVEGVRGSDLSLPRLTRMKIEAETECLRNALVGCNLLLDV